MNVFEDQFASMNVSNWSSLTALAQQDRDAVSETKVRETILDKLIRRFAKIAGIAVSATAFSASFSTSAQIANSQQKNVAVSENYISTETPKSFSASASKYDLSFERFQNIDSVALIEDEIKRSYSSADISLIEVEDYLNASANDDLKLGEQTSALVTKHGVDRIRQFSRLKDGWDSGHGAALRLESLKSFNKFFSAGDFEIKDLSVFMSSEGNLIANWLLKEETAVELEFDPKVIHYFNEALGDEYSVMYQHAGDFKSHLKRNASNA